MIFDTLTLTLEAILVSQLDVFQKLRHYEFIHVYLGRNIRYNTAKRYSVIVNSIFNFILKTNRQTAVCITNRASIYVMQSVMMDKKHNMNNNNNKS